MGVLFVLVAIGNGVEDFLIRHALDFLGAQVRHWHFLRCWSLPPAISPVALGAVLIEEGSSAVFGKRASD